MSLNNLKLQAFDIRDFLKQKPMEPSPNAVRDEVKKIAMSYVLKLKPHTFDDKETGEICEQLAIVIDFRDAVVQPHEHFEQDLCGHITEWLENEVQGLFENYEPPGGDDE